jgi:hypothetical protein
VNTRVAQNASVFSTLLCFELILYSRMRTNEYYLIISSHDFHLYFKENVNWALLFFFAKLSNGTMSVSVSMRIVS